MMISKRYIQAVSKQRESKKYDIDWEKYKDCNEIIKEQIKWLKKMFAKDISLVQELHKNTIRDITLLIDLYKKTREIYNESKSDSGKFDRFYRKFNKIAK